MPSVRRLSQRLNATAVLVQEPYVHQPIGRLTYQVAGWPSSVNLQPTNCSQEQRVSTAILGKNVLNVLIPSVKSNNIAINHIEVQGIEVVLINAYFPPRSDNEEMILVLQTTLLNLKGSAPVLVMGDFNARHRRWGDTIDTERGRELWDLMDDMEFQILNDQDRKMTFCSESNRVSAVDIAFFRDKKKILKTKFCIREEHVSDHSALCVELTFADEQKVLEYQIPQRFNIRKADWSGFREDIQFILQSKLNTAEHEPGSERGFKSRSVPGYGTRTEFDQISSNVDALTSMIALAAKANIPTSKAVLHAHAWWTKDLENLYRQKNYARNAWTRSRHTAEECLRKKVYKEKLDVFLKTQTSEMLRSWKDFVRKSSEENLWGLHYRIVRRKYSPPAAIVQPETSDGSIEDSLKEQAAKMFPVTTDTRFLAQEPTTELQPKPAFEPRILETEPMFTEREVRLAMKSLGKNKAPGNDLLTIEMLIHAGHEFLLKITSLFNDCLEHGIFPDQWKEAVLAIVPKPGKTDMTDVKSYRPVSLLNVMGKVLDKLMTNRLVHHLETNKCLNSCQFGFRQQKSTIQAIECAVKFAETRRSTHHTLFIALDISAAFDTAKHSVIQDKLNQTKPPKKLNQLIMSYLRNRSVLIRTGNHEYRHLLNQGCPQGSVIGPTLWNLSYDDLLRIMTKRGKSGLEVNFVAFADDALLQIRGTDVNAMKILAHELLLEIIQWSAKVGLHFNATKTEVMLVHQFRKPVSEEALGTFLFPANEARNVQLQFKKNFRYLGVILDEKLNFQPHLKAARDKANLAINDICRVVKQDWGLDIKKAMFLYNACIKPMLLYGAEVWGNRMLSVKTNKNILLSSQRKILLRATRAYRTTSTAALQAISNAVPIHLLAIMKYRLRQETLTSFEVEKRTEPYLQLHPSIDPCSVIIETNQELNPKLIPRQEMNQQITEYHACITWTLINEQFISQVKLTSSSKKLHHEILRFGKGVTEGQVSLFSTELLVKKTIEIHMQASKSQANLVIETKDRFLRCKLQKCSSSSLAMNLYKTCTKALQSKIAVLIFRNSDTKETKLMETELNQQLKSKETFQAILLVYNKKQIHWFKKKHYDLAEKQWQKDWEDGFSYRTDGRIVGRPTFEWIPRIGKSRNLTKNVIQAITGHGSFASYLMRFKLTATGICHCGATEENTQHVLCDCPAFTNHGFRAITSNENWKQEVLDNDKATTLLEDLMKQHLAKSSLHHKKLIKEFEKKATKETKRQPKLSKTRHQRTKTIRKPVSPKNSIKKFFTPISKTQVTTGLDPKA